MPTQTAPVGVPLPDYGSALNGAQQADVGLSAAGQLGCLAGAVDRRRLPRRILAVTLQPGYEVVDEPGGPGLYLAGAEAIVGSVLSWKATS